MGPIGILRSSTGHGSIHLRLEHALLVGQSELETHSVRHCEYGSPKYPLIQLQASLLLLVCILHLLHKDWENMDFSGPSVGYITSVILFTT